LPRSVVGPVTRLVKTPTVQLQMLHHGGVLTAITRHQSVQCPPLLVAPSQVGSTVGSGSTVCVSVMRKAPLFPLGTISSLWESVLTHMVQTLRTQRIRRLRHEQLVQHYAQATALASPGSGIASAGQATATVSLRQVAKWAVARQISCPARAAEFMAMTAM